MHVWAENEASRGGQEIASCLIKYFQTHLPKSAKHVILYSDSCGGQNRNIKMTLMLKYFMASSDLDLIEQKFFLSGHSYNSCDRSFGLVEKNKTRNYEIIATPDEWIEVILTAKKAEPKFSVTKMNARDFFSSKNLEKMIVNRKKNRMNEKISWLKFRSIIYDKEQLFTIFIRDDEGTRQVINIQKRGISEETFTEQNLSCLFPTGRKITRAKYFDLMSLKQYISIHKRPFYEALKYSNDGNDNDYALASGCSDNESDSGAL